VKDSKIDACYIPVFDKIDKFIKNDTPLIIAIDGMCGSGKSHLANLLVRKYDCNVFHMDDFYLPLEMRTKERLAQAGGNVHYERFMEEVLTPLSDNEKVIYQPYFCGVWKYGQPIEVEPKKLNIIEGSYSLHPQLSRKYTLSIFLEVKKNEQLQRILHRDGKEKLQDFIDKWIPLENLYFNHMKIRSKCDIIIDTTQAS